MSTEAKYYYFEPRPGHKVSVHLDYYRPSWTRDRWSIVYRVRYQGVVVAEGDDFYPARGQGVICRKMACIILDMLVNSADKDDYSHKLREMAKNLETYVSCED